MNREQLAEKVMEQHKLIAFSDDATVASCGLPIYDNSLALLIATIKAAYADVDTFAVYDIWCECNESVAHCVNEWRKEQIACGDLSCKGDCKLGYFLLVDKPNGNELTCLPMHTASEYKVMLAFLDANLPAGYRISGDL